MNKKTIEDVNVKGKRVLVRVDFNVPMDADKNITDENRIVGALPTIKYLLKNEAKVVLCSHMGKPHNVFNETIKLNKKEKAKIEALPAEEQEAATAAAIEKAKGDVNKLSLDPVAKRLSEHLGQEVYMAKDVIGEDAKAKAAALHQAARVHVATLAAKIGGYSRQVDLHMYLQSHSFEFIISRPLKKCNRIIQKASQKKHTLLTIDEL